MAKPIRVPISRWHHFFDETKFSTQEFYDAITEHVKKREVPKAKIERVKFSQDSSMFVKREYLKVKNLDYVFDICAAPYGTGYFVSWWAGETSTWIYRVFVSIPILGDIVRAIFDPRTYYQFDTATMFQECISKCVFKALEDINFEKGERSLTEMERQPTQIQTKLL